MLLRRLLLESGPWGILQDPDRMADRLIDEWKGVRVYMTASACKRSWRRIGREPSGAAERVAAAIESAILAEGGTEHHVKRVLIAAMGDFLLI